MAQNFSLALEYLFLNSPSSTTQNIVFSDELNEKNIEDNPFAVLKTLGKKIKSWICAAFFIRGKTIFGVELNTIIEGNFSLIFGFLAQMCLGNRYA